MARWGQGSPEGVIAARIGTYYQDLVNGTFYVKLSGTGNTGWVRTTFASGALTSGRVPYVDSNGRLADDAGLTYDAANDRLTAGAINVGSATGAAAGEVRASAALYAGLSTGYALQRQVALAAGGATNGPTATLVAGGAYAFAFLHEVASIGTAAIFSLWATNTAEIYDATAQWTVTNNNANTINVYHDGTNFAIRNNTTVAITVRYWCLHGV